MSEAMNGRESVQVQQPTQISEKVTTTLLDRMYNNFVKITDWVMKGKESKYPMPKALAWLFDTTESNQSEVAELKSLVGTLQQNLVQKEQRLAQLDTALQGVNAVLKQVVDAVNAQHQQAPAITQTQTEVVSEPLVVATPAPQPAPTPVDVVEELVDLDDVVNEQVAPAPVASQPVVSPNEQAIQVSAEAVGAGNIDPASYQALDAEIGALLSK
jgi:uncharacterized UPF0160 family protein